MSARILAAAARCLALAGAPQHQARLAAARDGAATSAATHGTLRARGDATE